MCMDLFFMYKCINMHLGTETLSADCGNYVMYWIRTWAFWHRVPGPLGTKGCLSLLKDKSHENVQKYFVVHTLVFAQTVHKQSGPCASWMSQQGRTWSKCKKIIHGNGGSCATLQMRLCSGANERESAFDTQYRNVLRDIVEQGQWAETSRGRCKCIYGASLKIEVSLNAPFLTLRRLPMRKIVVAMLWYLRGEGHVHWLREHGVRWWDAEADAEGHVGLNYGLLTNFPNGDNEPVNQLSLVIDSLVAGKQSRNMTVSLKNPTRKSTCDACIALLQFHIVSRSTDELILDLSFFQRSADWVVGTAHDVAAMYLLLWLVVEHVSAVSLYKARMRYLHAHYGCAHVYQCNKEVANVLMHSVGRPCSARVQLLCNTLARVKPWLILPHQIQIDGYRAVQTLPVHIIATKSH